MASFDMKKFNKDLETAEEAIRSFQGRRIGPELPILAAIKSLRDDFPAMRSTWQKFLDLWKARDEEEHNLRTIIESLVEVLNYTRVAIQYLEFDLEATQREKAELVRMLSEEGEKGKGPSE